MLRCLPLALPDSQLQIIALCGQLSPSLHRLLIGWQGPAGQLQCSVVLGRSGEAKLARVDAPALNVIGGQNKAAWTEHRMRSEIPAAAVRHGEKMVGTDKDYLLGDSQPIIYCSRILAGAQLSCVEHFLFHAKKRMNVSHFAVCCQTTLVC